MTKAIFLDRDGILIKERGDYNYKAADIEIVDGIAEALQALGRHSYVFIVITNQGGIGKGLYTHTRVREIHKQLKAFFSMENVKITDFYYCPHHPDSSACICRKPDSLLLEKAMARYGIDPEQSWFIGDNERDELAGKKAGLKTLLIPSNADLREYLGAIVPEGNTRGKI
jgi:D-glycero-D-manno-heptose 1,7-bisphosphate phosphatase